MSPASHLGSHHGDSRCLHPYGESGDSAGGRWSAPLILRSSRNIGPSDAGILLGHFSLQILQEGIGIPTLCVGQVEILSNVPLGNHQGVPLSHRVLVLDGDQGAGIGALDALWFDVVEAELAFSLNSLSSFFRSSYRS